MAKLTAQTRIKALPDVVYARIRAWAIEQRYEITSEKPSELLVLRTTKPFKADARVACISDGDYTQLQLDVDAAVPRLMEPIVRPQAEKQLRDALAELKKELEQ